MNNTYMMQSTEDNNNYTRSAMPATGGNHFDASQHKQDNPVYKEESKKRYTGALQSKNVRIHKRRTSVRLEPEMWNALNEIAALEGCSIHDLCGAVHDLKADETSFTAALRVFMMEYYRTAARTNGQVTKVQQKVNSKYNESRRNALMANL